MPPKKQQKASNKTEQKKKEKIIEDKTFGLKNKKGSKQQKFVKQVNHQVKHGNDPQARRLEQQRQDEKKRKELERKRQAEIDKLFKPVQKLEKGADPKSVLCAFFKQGLCQKGDKCKFSHDLAVGRKGEKRSIYSDSRDEADPDDTMEKWDTDKLHNVVSQKHGEGNKQKNRTQIVCKYFIQAIEEKRYGWFWVCPNGGKSCIYRHCLPPDYVLKSDRKTMEEQQQEKISIEDLVERERAALGSNVTKVTLETFLAWKKRKKEEKIKAMKNKKDKRKKDFKSGRLLGVSGREVFEFQPDRVGDDDLEADDTRYEQENEESEEVEVHGVSENMFVLEEVDAKLSQAVANRLKPPDKGDHPHVNGGDPNAPTSSKAPESTENVPLEEEEAIPVDENLFTEDLDDIDAELGELEI